jgi:hypothetical protein
MCIILAEQLNNFGIDFSQTITPNQISIFNYSLL